VTRRPRRHAAPVAATVVLLTPFLLGAAASGQAPAATVVATFADPAITESSGLVARDGLLVTVNDSGDRGRVFAVDEASGATIGTTSWERPEAVDVEALAPAPDGEVWVGDLGDNAEQRDSVEVLRVPVGRGDLTVDPERLTLTYPDGPHDAETLLADPATGRLVVVTKGVFGGRVYQAPVDPDLDGGEVELREIGTGPGIATDGAFFPDGRHLVVRDYSRAFVYSWPDLEGVGSFDLPEQEQGEGIAVDPTGRVLVSSEGQYADVLQVALPDRLARLVAGSAERTPGPTVAPGEDPTLVTDEPAPPQRPSWPFWLGGLLGVVGLGVLLRSMRPR